MKLQLPYKFSTGKLPNAISGSKTTGRIYKPKRN